MSAAIPPDHAPWAPEDYVPVDFAYAVAWARQLKSCPIAEHMTPREAWAVIQARRGAELLPPFKLVPPSHRIGRMPSAVPNIARTDAERAAEMRRRMAKRAKRRNARSA